MDSKELIEKYAADFEELFKLYTDFNAHTNISAISTKEDVYKKHFEDSLAAYEIILELINECPTNEEDKNAEIGVTLHAPKIKIIDVGTGGGFPTLPLVIVAEREGLNLEFIALDSTAKKLKFIEIVKGSLNLNKLTTLAARAEELASEEAYVKTEDEKLPKKHSRRESCDIALCRSVAHLRIILELCTPLIKKGGYFLAYKQSNSELEEAKTALEKLGVKFIKRHKYFNEEREILVFRKEKSTKKGLPRNYSSIKNNPL